MSEQALSQAHPARMAPKRNAPGRRLARKARTALPQAPNAVRDCELSIMSPSSGWRKQNACFEKNGCCRKKMLSITCDVQAYIGLYPVILLICDLRQLLVRTINYKLALADAQGIFKKAAKRQP
jgi:hypothetical protein